MNKDIGRVVISSRVDLLHLATVAQFLSERKFDVDSKSDLVRSAIEALAQAAEAEGLTDPPTSYKDAVALLETQGLSFRESEQSKQDVDNVLSLESLANVGKGKDLKQAVESDLENALAKRRERLEKLSNLKDNE